MKNVNTAAIAGNLTRNAELKGSCLSFSVAVNSTVRNGDEYEDYANFIDCAMFGKRAGVLKDKLTKGTKVFVSGSLHQSRWEDKDGNPRRAVSVYVDEIEIIAKSGDSVKKSEPREEIPFQW